MIRFIGSNEKVRCDSFSYSLICMATSSDDVETIINDNFEDIELFCDEDDALIEKFISDFKIKGKCNKLEVIRDKNKAIEILEALYQIIGNHPDNKKRIMALEKGDFQNDEFVKYEPSQILFDEQVIPMETKYIYELVGIDFYAYFYEI